MNHKQHTIQKQRGSSDITYLGRTVDDLIYRFMEEEKIDGLTLAIVQAPYIPRVVGYGVSDQKQKRLASVNTMWPVGAISQAFLAVAIMQLQESGKLNIQEAASHYLPALPAKWKDISILTLLRHASGIQDFRNSEGFNNKQYYSYEEVLAMVDPELLFEPGSAVAMSATNAILLTQVVERASQSSYHDYVQEHQIKYLNLKHTGFLENLKEFPQEDVSLTENVHQLFKKDKLYIDPIEPAASYDEAGHFIYTAPIDGFQDIWASAQDISFWDIALAGSVLIHEAENRKLIYAPWQLATGLEIPAVAGWQFYKHQGLMDIKGSIPGYSSFLSRFTDPKELVCVTLLANKEGVDFTNLGRQIAGAFGDLLATNYDDRNLYLIEGQLSVKETVKKLEEELHRRNIPVFAKFDHEANAKEAGLVLRPTCVVVFGSPMVGTKLMQEDQSISLELPLRISIWEDEAGSTWLAFRKIKAMAADYDLDQHPVVTKMETLMRDLVQHAGRVY